MTDSSIMSEGPGTGLPCKESGLADDLLIQRAEEVAEIAMRERKLGPLTAPYAAILLLAMADRIKARQP